MNYKKYLDTLGESKSYFQVKNSLDTYCVVKIRYFEPISIQRSKGCILVNANGSFRGAILGQKVKVITNSDILYDPRLKNAIFGLTKEGGWQISSFTEL